MDKGVSMKFKVSKGIKSVYGWVLGAGKPIKADVYEKEVHGYHIKGYHISACYSTSGSWVNDTEEKWRHITTLAPRI